MDLSSTFSHGTSSNSKITDLKENQQMIGQLITSEWQVEKLQRFHNDVKENLFFFRVYTQKHSEFFRFFLLALLFSASNETQQQKKATKMGERAFTSHTNTCEKHAYSHVRSGMKKRNEKQQQQKWQQIL